MVHIRKVQCIGTSSNIYWILFNEGDIEHPLAVLTDFNMEMIVKDWEALEEEG